MGLPIFAPSLRLLVDWQMNFKVMDELLWNCVQQACEKPSVIKAHRDWPHVGTDPNDIMNKTNLLYWLRFADFYQWPFIVYFDNWLELFDTLSTANVYKISHDMMHMKHNNVRYWDSGMKYCRECFAMAYQQNVVRVLKMQCRWLILLQNLKTCLMNARHFDWDTLQLQWLQQISYLSTAYVCAELGVDHAGREQVYSDETVQSQHLEFQRTMSPLGEDVFSFPCATTTSESPVI